MPKYLRVIDPKESQQEVMMDGKPVKKGTSYGEVLLRVIENFEVDPTVTKSYLLGLSRGCKKKKGETFEKYELITDHGKRHRVLVELRSYPELGEVQLDDIYGEFDSRRGEENGSHDKRFGGETFT